VRFVQPAAFRCRLLLFWQCWAEPRRPLVAGMAGAGPAPLLSKGPVALVLAGLTPCLGSAETGGPAALWRRLKAPCRGLGLSLLVCPARYGPAMLVWKGRSVSWDKLLGYHNLQRFSSARHDHLHLGGHFLPLMWWPACPSPPAWFWALARGLKGRSAQGTTRGEGGSERRLLSLIAPASPPCLALAGAVFFTLAANQICLSYWLAGTPAAAC